MGYVAGLKPRELAAMRSKLVEFAAHMFEPLDRSDQRRWGEVYLRGLMLDGRRKSIEPMADRLEDGDEQCLQQFVNQSPWDWGAVRERLAARISAEIGPAAWIIDDTGFPKFGRHSVGVARQYCGALGKVSNCQLGVSISAATEEASCPLDWRLFLPEEWDRDQERRRKAGVPDELAHEPKWKLALQMIDELRGWGLEAPAILGDAAYGDVTELRTGLEERGLSYVLDVKANTSAYAEAVSPERPDYAGTGRPPTPRYRAKPSSLVELSVAVGHAEARQICWREGSCGEQLSSRFLCLRVRPANVKLRNRAGREGRELSACWLLIEWPEGEPQPTNYWLSNLPEETSLERLVSLAKLRWRIEHDYRELKDGLGLDHFEGRSYRGWHHHVTLVSVAHGFLTLERSDPKVHAAA